MARANAVKLLIALAGFAAAGVIVSQRLGGSEAAEPKLVRGGEHWICMNESCEHTFSVSEAEAQARVESGTLSPECPACDESRVIRGYECPSCEAIIPPIGHGMKPKECPECQASIPK